MKRRRTPESEARRARVVELRRARWSFAEIARDLGVSAQRVKVLYDSALAQVPMAQVDEHRAEELELIDMAVRELLTIATSSAATDRSRIECWSVICKWSERRAKLCGLDSPVQVALDVQGVPLGVLDAELARLDRELGQLPPGDDA